VSERCTSIPGFGIRDSGLFQMIRIISQISHTQTVLYLGKKKMNADNRKQHTIDVNQLPSDREL
jgi:hypothetical protein